ncbi:hypothetical protein BH11PSE7_BH11PSE7_16480 [soil metagenome]
MPSFPDILRHIALFLLGTLMAIFGFYFAWTLAILYFKVSGRLHDGPMFHEMMTPGYSDTLISLAVCAAAIALCQWGRVKLRPRPPPP